MHLVHVFNENMKLLSIHETLFSFLLSGKIQFLNRYQNQMAVMKHVSFGF